MTLLRRLGARLMSTGVLSTGINSIVTGVALLVAASLLWSGLDTDPVAGPVGIAVAVLGVWSIERGVRRTWRRRED